VWAKGVWAKGVWAKGSWAENLAVSLDGDAAVQYGNSIKAFSLAEEAMKFWIKNEKDIT